MLTCIALYRGERLSELELITLCSDQEIVAREESGPAKVLWVIPPEHWDEGIAKQPAIQTRILEAAEDYGERGIRWILARECYPGVPF